MDSRMPERNINQRRQNNMKGILKITFAATLILIAIPAASTASNGTLVVGVPAPLDATDLTAICMDISRDGNAAWIELEKDGEVLYSHILKQGDPIVYESDSGLLAYRIDAIFRGIEHEMIELSPVDPPIDPSTIDFNYVQGLWDNFILDVGAEKDIGGGIILECTGIDLLDGTAWIELSRDGEVLYSHILREGECATYEYSGMLHACEVHRVFTGVGGNLVEFSPVKPSDIDVSSVPDRSDYIMVGLGVPVELSGGAKLVCKQIDLGGEAVWIEIITDDGRFEKVINETSPFTYVAGYKNYVYVLEAAFAGKEKSVIEISFVGSSPVAETPVSDRTPTRAIPAFTASAAIAGVLIVIYGRKRR